MTKRQALLKLRTDGQYRICLYTDYERLVKHLKHQCEYIDITVKGARPIRALKHNGLFFIPYTDETLTNCFYNPDKVNFH